MTYRLKIVPNTEPNADGEWVDYSGSEKPHYDMVIREGWHVVQITREFDDRSGESMYETAMRMTYR